MTTDSNIAATISDAEIEILQQLWEQSPLTAQDIIDRLQLIQGDQVHPKTVKTLINRLLNKGALGFHEKSRKYYYFPNIAKDAFYSEKTSSFLNKFFNGEITPLVSFFTQQKKLNENDLAELKQLLDRLEDDHDK